MNIHIIEEDNYRREGKVVAAGWGMYVLECRTSHLAERMI